MVICRGSVIRLRLGKVKIGAPPTHLWFHARRQRALKRDHPVMALCPPRTRALTLGSLLSCTLVLQTTLHGRDGLRALERDWEKLGSRGYPAWGYVLNSLLSTCARSSAG